MLVVELGDQPGRTLALKTGAPVIVGSGQTATWQLGDPELAPAQLHVELRGSHAHLTPLASEPTIKVNDEPADKRTTLSHGDHIDIGYTRLTFYAATGKDKEEEDAREAAAAAAPAAGSSPQAATRILQVPSMEEMDALIAAARDAYKFTDRGAVIEGMTGSVADQSYVLADRDTWLFGRGDEADIQIEDGAASRRHFQVRWEGDALWLEDVGSANGTTVNGKRVTQATPLRPSDMIAIGMTILRVDG